MANLTELRDIVAKRLNASIDIPYISEELELSFFTMLVERTWGIVPTPIKSGIENAASAIPADVIEKIRPQFLEQMLAFVRRYIPFAGSDNHEKLAHEVVSNLCKIAATAE